LPFPDRLPRTAPPRPSAHFRITGSFINNDLCITYQAAWIVNPKACA